MNRLLDIGMVKLFLFFCIVTLGHSRAADAASKRFTSKFFQDPFKPQFTTGTRFVVGGQISAPGAWPWQAALYMKEGGYLRFLCGASIIAPSILVSAAHCFYDDEENVVEAENFVIVVGKHDLRKTPEGSQRIPVSEVIIHDRYRHSTYDHDIALIKLDRDLKFTPAVQPVPLNEFEPKAGEMCWVTGYGKTNASVSGSSPTLMEAPLPIFPRKLCVEQYADQNLKITSDMLCAGYPEGGKASCSGDSGGPLVCNSTGKWNLCGVVSFGMTECGSKEAPGVFANIQYFRNWITMRARMLTMGSGKFFQMSSLG